MAEHLPTSLPDVTPRQRQVARLVAEGYTNERVAQELGITHDGAKYHVSELLGRLGFERREEIADWYRSQERRSLRERMRALVGTPLAWGAGAGAALAAVALLVVAFEGALGGGGGDNDATFGPGGAIELPALGPDAQPPVAEYVHEHEGERWRTRAAADLGERDLLFLTYTFDGAIHLLDRTTGEQVGEVLVPLLAHVAHVPASDWLIVSRLVVSTDDGTASGEEFLVFDIASGLTLGDTIALDGSLPEVWTNMAVMRERGGIALSADQRFLYFVQDLDAGPNVNPNSVGVIGLDGSAQLITTAPLDACRDPHLQPGRLSTMILTCRTGEVRLLRPDGSAALEVEATGVAGYYHGPDLIPQPAPPTPGPGEPTPVPGTGADTRQYMVPIVVTAETSDGVALFFGDGTYAVADPPGARVLGRALPDEYPHVVAWHGYASIDGRHVALPYYEEWREDPDSSPPRAHTGFVLFDIETGSIERVIGVEHYGAYPLGVHEMALVNEGRVDILDLFTMAVVQSFATSHLAAPEAFPAIR